MSNEFYNYDVAHEQVCAKRISFKLLNNNIHTVSFQGGCSGNLRAVSKLIEGMNAYEVLKILDGVRCGTKKSSCAHQLCLAIEKALRE
jgi:uncharacterized protein (TIGR03905 family)